MGTLWQDLRHGCRTLLKSPGFAAIAIVTLGLGMAVNTTIFSVVNGILLRPLPIRHPEQITVLATTQTGNAENHYFSYPDYLDLQKQNSVFSDLIGNHISLVGLAFEGKADHCVVSRVTGNYFSALGIKPTLGRLLLPTEGQTPGADPVIVLGYSFWQKRFGGDRSVIGKQAQVNDHPVTIIGVAPKEFHGTYWVVDMDAYIPISVPIDESNDDLQRIWTSRDDRVLGLLGRLKPRTSPTQAQTSLNVVAQRLAEQYPDTDKGTTIQVYPEKLARPEPDKDNPIPAAAAAFVILAALVLLVACFNVANVLLVRATVRQREMAIRAALGAGRARLVRQYLTESCLLALFGGAAGLTLASWAGGFLSSLPLATDLPFRLDFSPDATVYLYALATVIVTGVIVGIIPALRAARTDVSSVLHEGGRGSSDGPRRHFVRNALVVGQVAGSFLLLVVAGLFVRSLQKAQHLHLGFDPDHVLNLSMDTDEIGYPKTRSREFYREIDARLRALPGVVSVAQAFSVPMGYIGKGETVYIEGHPPEPGQHAPSLSCNSVSTDYFATLHIPILRGRAFTESDNENTPAVAIVNQTMAKRFWPDQDPLGKRFSIKNQSGPFVEVVGVAQDGKYDGVIEDPKSFFYLPFEQDHSAFRTIQVRTSVPPENLELQIEEQIRKLAPGLAVSSVQTMSQSLQGANGFLFFHLGAQLTATMGLLGLILAVVGVYSVVSYAAAQRTHEIGIRIALGAERRDILRMVLSQGMGILAIGLGLGLAAAFVGTRAIANMFVGISAYDPATYAVVAALLLGVALLASWVPARRSMRVDPMVALRYE